MTVRSKPKSTELETVEIKYLPVRDVARFDRNPKRHDVGGVSQSIALYGFRNPPIWDSNLNDGTGGIAAGNGRIEALLMMEQQGQDLPRGIAVNDKRQWCLPIVFGCDAINEAEAIAYAVDDNNLTMAGGDFDHFAMAGMWDQADYLELLKSIADQRTLPITVDEDALASLILMADRRVGDEDEAIGGEDGGGPKMLTCPNCGHEFSGGAGNA